MEKYDYNEAVTECIEEVIKDKYPTPALLLEAAQNVNFFTDLKCEILVSESVTGLRSNSFTCDAYRAEENICHNWGLIVEMIDNLFFESGDPYRWVVNKGPDIIDSLIRTYLAGKLLPGVVNNLIKEAKNEVVNE